MSKPRSFSVTFPRTIDGLRVAVAGLPDDMPIALGEGVEIEAQTIGDLRRLHTIPHRIEVSIPYRLELDTTIAINRMVETGENF